MYHQTNTKKTNLNLLSANKKLHKHAFVVKTSQSSYTSRIEAQKTHLSHFEWYTANIV